MAVYLADLITWLRETAADPAEFSVLLIIGLVLAAVLGDLLGRMATWGRKRMRRLRIPHDVDAMSGIEFEDFLADLFRRKGFQVAKTAVTGDYGVDLILTNPATGERIAVQAKRYAQSVGIEAVQQVYFGAAYYGCHRALVVTNADYTPNARIGAGRVSVLLINGAELKAQIARVFGNGKKAA